MKKIILFLFIPLLFFSSSCPSNNEEYIVSPMNQLIKDLFCFKTDSEWVYYDSISQMSQIMLVTNYDSLILVPKGKYVYECSEIIEMNILVGESEKETRLSSNLSQKNIGKGRIATPTNANSYFSIRCDENNNFTPPATYFDTYSVNGKIYSDVYVFNDEKNITIDGIVCVDTITYYVSKNTGFIRCIYQCKYHEPYSFDWVLIDKNVKQ